MDNLGKIIESLKKEKIGTSLVNDLTLQESDLTNEPELITYMDRVRYDNIISQIRNNNTPSIMDTEYNGLYIEDSFFIHKFKKSIKPYTKITWCLNVMKIKLVYKIYKYLLEQNLHEKQFRHIEPDKLVDTSLTVAINLESIISFHFQKFCGIDDLIAMSVNFLKELYLDDFSEQTIENYLNLIGILDATGDYRNSKDFNEYTYSLYMGYYVDYIEFLHSFSQSLKVAEKTVDIHILKLNYFDILMERYGETTIYPEFIDWALDTLCEGDTIVLERTLIMIS